MRQLLRKFFKALAYVAAAVVIMLALAVGLFRLMLPRLPEYQESIKQWADAAIGMQVQFQDMDARWRLSGPELSFSEAVLTPYNEGDSLLAAGEVSVGVSLMRLITDRQLVVDRIELQRISLSLQFSDDDGWLVQGRPLASVFGSRQISADQGADVAVVATDIDVVYTLPDSGGSIDFSIDRLDISRSSDSTKIDAVLELPAEMGDQLELSVVQQTTDTELGIWQFFVEANDLQLPRIMGIDEKTLPQFSTGTLDVSASVQRSNKGIEHATAEFVLQDLTGEAEDTYAPLDAEGRLEFSRDSTGWLVAGSNFSLSTVDETWPQTTLSLQVAHHVDGGARSVSVASTYLNLDDHKYLLEWLPPDIREAMERYQPSGSVRGVNVLVDNIGSDEVIYDLEFEMIEAGVAATNAYPGVRRLSGLLRANNSGGRIDVSSSGMVLDLTAHLSEPIALDDAIGTLIWRRNAQGTTLLSDNVRIRNADFDSTSSLQILLPVDGGAPVVDFQSDWSINDVSSVGRYLPVKKIKPGLYRWLSEALVRGYAPYGTMQLTGPLDEFPFDNGGGVFRIEGHLEETTLRYGSNWPVVENMTLDVVVDGMRLFSNRNSAVNAGNSVVDARIEIDDLRRPTLEIDAFATGSLESIRRFSRESPISTLFGGHLEKVSVGGEASFRLELQLPILQKEDYTFETNIQISDGTLAFAGFPAPLTEVNGVVNISKETVWSETLFGTFLGAPVDLVLQPAGEEMPSYSILATASGQLSDEGLINELAPALEGVINGRAPYTVDILFPKPGGDTSVPLQIAVGSQLDGIGIDLPGPLRKSPADPRALDLKIEFPVPGVISTFGSLGDQLIWSAGFLALEDGGWDFDRGSLAIGGTYPESPDTRGLHISGGTDSIVFDDWLDLARRGSGELGIADRIRTIDLSLGNLYVLGQDLQDHRVRVERSGESWFVTVDGDKVIGQLTVPYDFDSGRPLVAEMETLILPGWDEKPQIANEQVDDPDPRGLPPINVTAEQFALGDRHFGRLHAEFASTVRGLESMSLSASDPSFSINGSAGWLYNGGEPYTYIDVVLSSSDIRATMDRLNYQPGITGDQLSIDLAVRWPGPPSEDFMDHLSGDVSLAVGAGQLDDVEPGAGRVFGLMSIVALPRRLSLDFTDVLEKGFGFDRITGSFRIEDGDAYTCDLSLEGPAADVGIVGRAGLSRRDYNQTALVSANVGNTLPVLGAVIAGPQIAAALLVFSQIFKKPLQDIGQVYYGIDGSWDTPIIASADGARFAENSEQAGCLAQSN